MAPNYKIFFVLSKLFYNFLQAAVYRGVEKTNPRGFKNPEGFG
jgi:hypothetical protein